MSTRREHFPPTERTFVVDMIVQGRSSELTAHIMRVYDEPLQIYFSATSFRSLGEPRDIVAGYFASRLARSEWLSEWQLSWENEGIRLSRWLVNGLNFFLFEVHRTQQRERKERGGRSIEAIEVAGDMCASAGVLAQEKAIHASGKFIGAAHVFDRAHARVLVREALTRTEAACTESGQSQHFDIFMRHCVEQIPYELIAAKTALSPIQCAGLVRTVSMKFRRAIAELLVEDGADPCELDHEIARLMESLAR